MNAVSIPTVKRIIRSFQRKDAAAITFKAMTLATAKEVEEYVAMEMAQRFPDLF